MLEAEKDKRINNKPPNPPMNKKKSLPEELSDLKRVALETPKVQRIDGLSKRDDISNSQSELLKEKKVEESMSTELSLQPLKIDTKEFMQFANDYTNKLTPEMKESFYDNLTLHKKMEEGYERHYMKIIAFHKGKKMAHGLACVNVDQTCSAGHRAFIRHVSVIRNELFPNALKLVTNFIWRRIHCDHIRVELFHLKDAEGKMAADPVIKKALADSKFRWKNLSNDPITGKRSQIMELKKPTTGEAAASLPAYENTRNLQPGKEPVTIKSGVIFELGTLREGGKKPDNQNASNSGTLFAPVSVLASLKKFKEEAQDGSILTDINADVTD